MASISGFNWQPYLPLARKYSLVHGIAPEVILAVMAQESAFKPRAYRAEPQINDASRGLMQLLLKTARGLGFTGAPDELFDPDTNVNLGTKLLAQNMRARSYNLSDALSMYNGGYRPSLGFGAKRPDGTYGNQYYVDRVIAFFHAFDKALHPATGTPATGGGSAGGSTASGATPPATNGFTTSAMLAVLVGVAAALLWRVK